MRLASIAVSLLVGAACGGSASSPVDAAAASDAAVVDAVPADAAPDAFIPPPVDVDVVITADNAYSFGYGDANAIATYIPGTRAVTAGQIFNCPVGVGPEHYVVPGASAPLGAYLYVVSWDDLSVTQGVLGQFKRDAAPLYTGDAAWEVCATGIDLSASATGPSQAEVNAQLAICNAGTGSATTTSKGWVNTAGAVTAGAIGAVAIGEANDTAGGTFPQVCPAASGGVDLAAHWMWYTPGNVANPFQSTGTNTFRAYLIFRLPASEIPVN
jgi:hypothetical protein